MGCCGQRRVLGGAPFRPASTTTTASSSQPVASPKPRPVLRLVYEYSGNGAFTVASSTSGRRYRFEHPGARIEVDPRDRTLMASLRQVRRVV